MLQLITFRVVVGHWPRDREYAASALHIMPLHTCKPKLTYSSFPSASFKIKIKSLKGQRRQTGYFLTFCDISLSITRLRLESSRPIYPSFQLTHRAFFICLFIWLHNPSCGYLSPESSKVGHTITGDYVQLEQALTLPLSLSHWHVLAFINIHKRTG